MTVDIREVHEREVKLLKEEIERQRGANILLREENDALKAALKALAREAMDKHVHGND